jgi:acetolactate synthase-1/2/3 large subunit
MEASSQLVSERIADLLSSAGITQVFGITGAGNIHLFDALARSGKFNLTFTHHEQAAVMAATSYYRVKSELALALVTTGAGASNALTGVLGANMDSIPVLVIAGNEPSRYTKEENLLRVWGTQGFDSVKVFSPVTKFSKRLLDAKDTDQLIFEAIGKALEGKFGVSWLEIPLDIQTLKVSPSNDANLRVSLIKVNPDLAEQVNSVSSAMQHAKRPLIWIGHGVRLGDALEEVKKFIEKVNVPFLLSWAGGDVISNNHPLYVGKPGVYGSRVANFSLQTCDYVLAIGTRLAIPQIGYNLQELAPKARIDVVDISAEEVLKHGSRITEAVISDAKNFLLAVLEKSIDFSLVNLSEWHKHIDMLKKNYPLIDYENDHTDFLNSHRFINEIQEFFEQDEVVVTDAGTAFLGGNYSLQAKGDQRIISSTGLGEMGFGLPAAVGAAIARPGKRVICLNTDGAIMMNLQELQTIVHNKLPIKIFIFSNEGYLSIKLSQSAMLGKRYVGVDSTSGLSCPDYMKIGNAFGIPVYRIETWSDFENKAYEILGSKEPAIVEVLMNPEQLHLPRLQTKLSEDGVLVSPPLEDLFPLLDINELERALLRKPNLRSYALRNIPYEG